MRDRVIFCIDLRSFFAAVECADAGLDLYQVPLVVSDRRRGMGAITLAVTPFLKAKGIPSRGRLFELPKNEPIIYALPRMRRYVEVSSQIVNLYLNYVSEEDLHVYSIDEAFLDVTTYLSYFEVSPETLAHTIQQHIMKETKIPSTIGIGPNMVMAKMALDLDSKRMSSGIARWTHDDLETRLWPVTPLSDVWGIGRQMERRLNAMNIHSMYDVAHAPIAALKEEFGVLGEELYYHAHGLDASIMSDPHSYQPRNVSIGHGQTLYHDYNATEAKLVLRELVDRVTKRLRAKGLEGSVIHVSVGYSKQAPGGFSRQQTIASTDSPNAIYQVVIALFDQYYTGGPIRRLGVSVGHVTAKHHKQLDLFGQVEQQTKERALWQAMDQIQTWYGKNACLRAVYFKPGSTMRERNGLIGGHRA
jgi:DNA polymerase V